MPIDGIFIVLEGADGVGKQTQTEMLARHYREQGRDVRLFSFPRYKTYVGGLIKELLCKSTTNLTLEQKLKDAMILQCLMLADKYEAAQEIRLHVAEGGVVIADRWWQSALAYGGADGLDKQWIFDACRDLPQAHVNILLDVSHATVRQRKPIPDDRYEANAAQQAQVRETYQQLWNMRTMPGHWVMLFADRDRTDVHETIVAGIKLAVELNPEHLGECLD